MRLALALALTSCRLGSALPGPLDAAPYPGVADSEYARHQPHGMTLRPLDGDDDAATAVCIDCHQTETPGEVARYQRSLHAHLATPVRCVDCHGRDGHGEYLAFGYRFAARTLDADGVTPIGGGGSHVYYEWQPKMIVRAMQGCQRAACHGRAYAEHVGVDRRVTQPSAALTPFHGMLRFDHGISSWNDTMMASFGLALWASWGTEAFREACVRCHNQVLAWNLAGPSPDRLSPDEPFLRDLLERQARDLPAFAEARFPGVADASLLLSRCVECHLRHEFTRSSARHATACGKCHSGPDHPQIEAFDLSKHRLVVDQRGVYSRDNPVGGPSCATCHMGRVADARGAAPGAVSHDLTRGLAWNFRPGSPRFREERQVMLDRCSSCHASEYAAAQLASADHVARRTTDQLMAEIRALCKTAYDRHLIRPAQNPFFGRPVPFAPTFFHALPWRTGKYQVSPIELTCWNAWRERALLSVETGAWHFSPQFTQWLGLKPADEFIGRLREQVGVP
jgi:hypothetical protein